MNTETKHTPVEPKVCCGPTWGIYVDGRCATCGDLPAIAQQRNMAKEIAQLKADRDELVEALDYMVKTPVITHQFIDAARNLIAKHSKV